MCVIFMLVLDFRLKCKAEKAKPCRSIKCGMYQLHGMHNQYRCLKLRILFLTTRLDLLKQSLYQKES